MGSSAILGPLCSQKALSISKSTISMSPSRSASRVFCLGTTDTRTDTLQYILELINISIAKFDKWWFNVWKPFSHSSHWLTGIQKESPLQMSKTQMNSKTYCFNKTCCVDHDRDTCEITTLDLRGNFEEGNAIYNIHWNLEIPYPLNVLNLT